MVDLSGTYVKNAAGDFVHEFSPEYIFRQDSRNGKTYWDLGTRRDLIAWAVKGKGDCPMKTLSKWSNKYQKSMKMQISCASAENENEKVRTTPPAQKIETTTTYEEISEGFLQMVTAFICIMSF